MNSTRHLDECGCARVARVQDPDSRNFAAAWRVLTQHDDEKPAKRLELTAASPSDEERAAKVKEILARVASTEG